MSTALANFSKKLPIIKQNGTNDVGEYVYAKITTIIIKSFEKLGNNILNYIVFLILKNVPQNDYNAFTNQISNLIVSTINSI